MKNVIHVQRYPSKTASLGSLLFVHGAYVDSRCWEFNFIPYFQQHGYDCIALDLSGHGKSQRKLELQSLTIDDYVDDLSSVINNLDQQVTLVGHSMGCRVIERYLKKGQANAAVFLSPVPTTGTANCAVLLAMRHPLFFNALSEITEGKVTQKSIDLMTKVYFSPQTQPSETLKFLPMVGPESMSAIAEMAIPEFTFTNRTKVPSLVVGGDCDAVFPSSLLHFMASAWNAKMLKIKGAGHMLILDPQWETAANGILSWLNSLDTPRVP